MTTHSIKYRPIFNTLAVFLLVFSVAGCEQANNRIGAESSFQLLDGETKSLDDYEGRWLLINFWAEWCAPCIAEVPILNQLYRDQDKHNISLLAFSYDRDSNAKLKAAKQKYEMEYPVVATDPQPMVPFGRPNMLPALYVISPIGELFGPFYGKQSEDDILDQLEYLKQGK